MYFRHKTKLWLIFIIFFVILSPFLAFYSLGYNLDFNQAKLNNTINIDINTIPRGAEVWNKNFLVATTPGSLKANDGQLISLQIKKEGYLKEKFDIWSKPNQNTTARIEDIYLLPTENKIKDDSKDKTFLAILSKNLLLYESKDSIFIQLYSFGGLEGSPEMVQNLVGQNIDLQEASWEDLLEDMYWQPNSNLLLYKVAGKWYLLNLLSTQLDIINTIRINETTVLALDIENKLWQLDLPTAKNSVKITFLINDIDGISFTKSPDSIWMWRSDKIYSIPKGNTTLFSNNLEIYEYFTNSYLADLSRKIETVSVNNISFAVKNVHQGLAFKIDTNLYYVPDYATDKPVIISDNVTSFVTTSNTIFWLNSDFGLYSLNLSLNKQQFFGILDIACDNLRNIRLFYYNKWERIFVYLPDQVISIWFDKNIINESVVTYYPNHWIEASRCQNEVNDDFQFCIKSGQLISYQNTEIW